MTIAFFSIISIAIDGNISISANAAPTEHGVMASAGNRTDAPAFIGELGASWVRVNSTINGKTSNNFVKFLDEGINVIITLTHRDPNNSVQDLDYGTVSTCPNGGFPFIDEQSFKDSVQTAISLAVPYLDTRQVWVQAENEVSDASVNSDNVTDVCMKGGKYWHGTTDQYLTNLKALHDAVKELDPRMKVVMSGFTSQALDSVIGDSSVDYRYDYQYSRLTKMFNSPNDTSYDAVDLHFYACADDIAAKAQWLKDHLPAGKLWITTENSGPNVNGDIIGIDRTTGKSQYRECPEYLGERGTEALPWWQTDLAAFEAEQANQINVRMNACANNGGSICLWFSLFDLDNEVDVFNHLGLLDKDDIDPTITNRKPSFYAYQDFINNLNLNSPPIVNYLSPVTVNENTVMAISIIASDPDNDPITMSAANLPAGASFNITTHIFSWQPNFAQAGTYIVTFTATDDKGLSGSQNMTITVVNLNQAPVLNEIGNKSVNENSALTFTVSASDADNTPLTYSAAPLPSGASFNTLTKTFNWTPSSTQSGIYSVTFTVSDGILTDSEVITITVIDNDVTAPVISGVSANPSSTTATITWTTDELSDSQVEYGLSNSDRKFTTTNNTLVKSHSVSLSGLSKNKSYTYRVYSKDAAGNLSISQTFTFKTKR